MTRSETMKKTALAAFAGMLALAAAGADAPIKIMTFNIMHGARTKYGPTHLDQTAARISAVAPDFCCLQEVDDNLARSGYTNQTARLAELTGMHGTFAYALLFKGDSEHGQGRYGNAILSKEAPLSVTELRMSEYSTANPPEQLGAETRVLLICEFKDFCVATAHLNGGEEHTLAYMQDMRKALESSGKPVFFTGDWNAKPNSRPLAAFKEFLTVISPETGISTINSNAGSTYVIDYITLDTAHTDDFYVRSSYLVEDLDTSDHSPLVAEVYPVPTDLGWIDERAVTQGRTGAWSRPLEYVHETMRAGLWGLNVFSPSAASGGCPVTLDVTMAFATTPTVLEAPDEGAQAAAWLGTNGMFQVWTDAGGGGNGWTDVAVDGVTPEPGVDYTFRFTLDYAAQTYSVDLIDATGESPQAKPLRTVAAGAALPAGASAFPLATPAASVSSLRFSGSGDLASISGEYVEIEGFSEGERVALKNAREAVLDAAKAAWLSRNAFARGKAAVGDAAARLSEKEFSDAYLLNLDITGDTSCSLRLTGIDVADGVVTVGVSLVRGGKSAQAINGRLRFYGAATVGAFADPELEPLGELSITDDDFSQGDSATVTFRSGGNAFFSARIEER